MVANQIKGIGVVLDNYSNYDYKETFDAVSGPYMAPSWVGDHSRRLTAYALLESYYSNSSRAWLNDEDTKKNRREYGDANVLVETALVSLLGNSQRIIVEGSLVNDPAAVALQQAIDQWATDEKFQQKMIESERQSVKYGDSVYALAPDAAKGRPRLHVYDPGFYFPVFDELGRAGSEDFPDKVHIAWEFEMKDPINQRDKTYVRRITWELVTVETPYTTIYSDTPTNVNCFYEDSYWELSEVGQDMTVAWGSTKKVITERVAMNIDFLPVVHIPNTVSLQQHFGTSVLAPIMQILDDIQGTDTDLQAAAATTGTPPIAVTGRPGQGGENQTSYGPGLIFYVGDGSATVLDTSQSLDALLKLKDALLERLSVNSRTPEALLGRVKPNEVPSGIAMTLSFAPHTGLINEMRLVRKEKYRLLFKFAMRLMGQQDTLPTDLVLGSFLPADKQEAMTMVVQLLGAKAVSLETAVRMLAESGIPIESWVDEIARIQSRDADTAMSLMSLTGDPNTGLTYMGLPTITVTDDLTQEDDPDA